MGTLIYAMCALTSLACFAFLWRSWRRTRAALLFWSGLCFALLTANNLLLVVDKVVLPEVDLRMARLAVAAVAIAVLLFGLVWGED